MKEGCVLKFFSEKLLTKVMELWTDRVMVEYFLPSIFFVTVSQKFEFRNRRVYDQTHPLRKKAPLAWTSARKGYGVFIDRQKIPTWCRLHLAKEDPFLNQKRRLFDGRVDHV